jgi:TrmH family RNA methyltransferase
MGSALRIKTCIVDKEELILKGGDYLYICDSSGKNINISKAPESGIMILGNESLGVSDDLLNRVNEKFAIPGDHSLGAESLNVASAAAIIAAWWMKMQ